MCSLPFLFLSAQNVNLLGLILNVNWHEDENNILVVGELRRSKRQKKNGPWKHGLLFQGLLHDREKVIYTIIIQLGFRLQELYIYPNIES